MVSAKLFQLEFIFEESEDSEFLELMAQGDIDGDQTFAGDAEFDDDFVGDGDGSEVEFLDVGSQIAYFVDEFVGDVCFVLEVKILQF